MRNDVVSLEHRNFTETSSGHVDSPHELLAVAIVRRAVEDFEQAMTFTPCGVAYRKQRQYKRHVREECERFFYGEWYRALCSIDPDVIIRRILVRSRSKTLKTFDRKMMRARLKRKPETLEDWQIREIRLKRGRRCSK